MPRKKLVLLGVRVPAAMHRELKEMAAREGTSMQDIVTDLIEDRLAAGRRPRQFVLPPVPPRSVHRYY